jgi:hypothetical protein
MWQVWVRGEKFTKFLLESPKERGQSGRPKRRWEIVIRMDLKQIGCWVWSGFIWLRIGIGGGFL